MQQPSSSRSQRPVGIFRTLPLSEISQTYAWFEERRANAPVFQDEHMPFPLWQVFRYEDVLTVLNDYNRFSSQAFGVGGGILADTLVAEGPPHHPKLRQLVNPAITPRPAGAFS